MPVIPALGRLRQENCELSDSLEHIARNLKQNKTEWEGGTERDAARVRRPSEFIDVILRVAGS